MNKSNTPQRKPLTEVVAAEAERLAADRNIAAVGIGLKFVRGRPTLQAAVQYHVYAKLGTDEEIERRGSVRVPAEVEGYATDVLPVVLDRRAACPGSKSPTGDRGGSKEDPLLGGTSTTVLGDFHSFPTGYGTLGGLCFDASNGDSMALSNAHVYGSDLGNDAIQPWLPTSEYLEAGVKYLFCGGPLAHLFFWTAPSPLTGILTTAAAAAWVAAIASDAEDPSRWGQRTGPVPPAGTATDRERVQIRSEVPHLPFPGRHWRAKTHWDYTRVTNAGETTVATDDPRLNEHVLVGKRVFTDRDVYRPGDRVTICAQLWSRADVHPAEHFVVATSFPIADPSRTVRRVLVPGDICGRHDKVLDSKRKPQCVRGFKPQVEGLEQMALPIVQWPFVIFGAAGTTQISSADNPANVLALRVPEGGLRIACPPSTHIELEVFHTAQRIRASAFSANGVRIDQAQSTDDQGALQKIRLTGPEIVRVEIEGGGGEGWLVGICADKRQISVDRWKAVSRYYTGAFDLGLQERAGKWAVVVVAQTLDDTPTGGDPIDAARRLGGMVDSANIVETGECACTILFDHTFDVVPVVIE